MGTGESRLSAEPKEASGDPGAGQARAAEELGVKPVPSGDLDPRRTLKLFGGGASCLGG